MSPLSRLLALPMSAVLCAGPISAFAQADSDSAHWEASLGAGYRRLFEEENGARLLTEKGPLAKLTLARQWHLQTAGALRLELAALGASLDYDGQTQSGSPLTTTATHHEFDASVFWRPWATADWGEVSIAARAWHQRRDIESTGPVLGLTETSNLLMPGVRWLGPAFPGGSWTLQPQATLWTSVRHRLRVSYQGAFDDSNLTGARRTQLVLGLTAHPADSPWRFSAEWARSRQPASEAEPLYRGGVLVGTVHQPRLGFDDLVLSIRRSF